MTEEAKPAVWRRLFEQDAELATLRTKLAEATETLAFIDAWVSNPVGAYSVTALDGLFAATRDRIAALSSGGSND